MMPILFSSSSYNLSSSLFFIIIIIFFPNHPCNARKLQTNKQAVLEDTYFTTDSSPVENGPKGIVNRSTQNFNKEKNDNKVVFSDREVIGSESCPSSLLHARLLKLAKTKGARWSATDDIHVASQTGNKNLYRDTIEMDYDPPHRKSPIHN